MRTRFGILALLIVVMMATPLYGQRLRFEDLGDRDHELEFRIGHLSTSDIFNNIGDFKGTSFKVRYGHFTSQRNQIGLELGLIDTYNGADGNIWTGTIGYRRFFSVNGSTALSYDLALGGAYLTEESSDLGSKLNFHEEAGITLHQAISSDSSLNLGFRFSHTSNAGLRKPNKGINASVISIGYSRYY